MHHSIKFIRKFKLRLPNHMLYEYGSFCRRIKNFCFFITSRSYNVVFLKRYRFFTFGLMPFRSQSSRWHGYYRHKYALIRQLGLYNSYFNCTNILSREHFITGSTVVYFLSLTFWKSLIIFHLGLMSANEIQLIGHRKTGKNITIPLVDPISNRLSVNFFGKAAFSENLLEIIDIVSKLTFNNMNWKFLIIILDH
jgi:hypothetical protein